MEGGGTLSEKYSSLKKVLLRARDGLEKLERIEFSSASRLDCTEFASDIKRDVTQAQCQCVEMDRLWRSIAAKSQRDLWKRKVEQMTEEADWLKDSLDKYHLRNQRRISEAKERAELLGRRAKGQTSHSMRIYDEESQELQALQSARNSSGMLEEAYATGVAILSKYAEQRDRLKSAQRKALDVLNTVGLSNSVLRLVERRHRMDRWIKYAGMVLTVVFLFFILRWRR